MAFQSPSVPEGYRQHLEPVVFTPWATRLIDLVGVEPGQTVLDVASGTGVVARAAAAAVGPRGRVIASDISAGMLAHATVGLIDGAAPIETLECSATDLGVADGSIDVVLCQQGFPFIPDRAAATREMHRVLRTGGTVGIAVWLSGPRLDPFDTYGEVLEAEGIAEPFPRAYDNTQFKMSLDEVEEALIAGCFAQVEVVAQDLEVHWPSAEAAALGITGTPYGPGLATLDEERQHALMAQLRQRFASGSDGPVGITMTAVLARGTAS